MRAMILLGVNCGFGQTDFASSPGRPWQPGRGGSTSAARRPGRPAGARCGRRRSAALKAVECVRPAPARPEYDRLVFLTRSGRPWVRTMESTGDVPGCRVDRVGQDFPTLAGRLGLPTTGFYCLRHTFRTVADEVRDHVAAGLIMGHVDETMAGQYRERVADERLQSVVDHVRGWLMAGRPSV